MSRHLPLFVSLFCTGSFAAPAPVYLETPVTIAPDASIPPRIREECRVNDMFELLAAPAFANVNGSVGTVSGADTDSKARRVRVQIIYIQGLGGGAWTGAKTTAVRADLVENGVVVAQTGATRRTGGGPFAAVMGNCAMLERNATALGKDLVRWANNPKRKPLNEAVDVRQDGGADVDARTPASAPSSD